MNWFRLYAEMMDDPKVGTLDDPAFRLWVDTLCLAAQGDGTGATGLDVAGLAWRVRRPLEGVQAAVAAFVDRGLVTVGSDGRIAVVAWERRQRPSDSSAARVRAHRERKATAVKVDPVTVTVTETGMKHVTSPPLPSPLSPPLKPPPYIPPTLTPTTSTNAGEHATAAERNDSQQADSGSEPGTALVLTGGAVLAPVEILPTRSGVFPVPADQADAWQRVYPAVNVRAELGRIFAWLDANPKQRPTETGVRRFVNTWLAREQDRAAERGARPHLRAVTSGGDVAPLQSKIGRAVSASMARVRDLERGQ